MNWTFSLTKDHCVQYPYPYRGGGRGRTKPTCRIPLFLLGNPGIVIQLLKWNFTATFLDKPWALVRKYLRLAPGELSASMMMATQFLEGCHPYTCAASVWHVLSSSGAKRKYLMFICLPMKWNDEECWSLRKINAKMACQNEFSVRLPPSNFIFKRVGFVQLTRALKRDHYLTLSRAQRSLCPVGTCGKRSLTHILTSPKIIVSSGHLR